MEIDDPISILGALPRNSLTLKRRARVRHSRLKLPDRYPARLTTRDKNQRAALTVATLN